ncbi:PREDICTED: fatty acyl-CoA reductase 1-like [Papilio xuthus]|uniref:Fatty acyl-CoA reductase n=1 Tax=Papilio xuthus TaxID=66420 RepID=A0AAJ6ZQQ5_PAPXU|nr:PREDICTED: fatty acyl-CoA reductase 1-like [Papilio xuthus]XP_013177309.1 PREDICTED: fatty acyl-CoA reductase 1-like [Papilio xuthus]
MANTKTMQTCADVREMNNINNKVNQTHTQTGEPVEVDGVDNNINIVDKYCADCTEQERVGEHAPAPALSDIQQFYHGKNVLITGATGFLGKILVEKLLRCCPGVDNLYLLVRRKRGQDIYSRLEDIFEDPVFDRLKAALPKFRHKVVGVPADCAAPGLGLSLADRQLLTEKVNVMFHCAATVKFDEQLRAALATNVRAPLHLLRLARDMRALDVLMHVSTAYSNSHLAHVEERFYPCAADTDRLQLALDNMTDAQIDQMLPTILGEWPNTYTFTKALAEKELRLHAGDVPLGVFRPAIVTSTAKEPLKCWLDNMYGPTGVAVGSATGMLRSLQCDARVTADLVPVDCVVNCLLAAARNVHLAYAAGSPPPEPPIFNYVSSVENRITWGDFKRHNFARIDSQPFSNAVWYISLQLTRSARLHRVYTLVLHLAPAALVDALALCLGRKPRMLKVYTKIHKFSEVISYFCTREITFCNRRTRHLWDATSQLDRQLFPFSMAEVDWEEYFDDYLLGIRRYLFKQTDDSLPRARIKWKRLYYLHQIVRIIFFVLSLYAVWCVLALIW